MALSKGNIHKKATHEDKFDRKYACWVQNNRKRWHFDKVRNRKQYRRKMKGEIKDERDEYDSD